MRAILTVDIDRIHTVIMRLKVHGFRVICFSVRQNLLLVEGDADSFSTLLRAPFDGVESIEMTGESINVG